MSRTHHLADDCVPDSTEHMEALGFEVTEQPSPTLHENAERTVAILEAVGFSDEQMARFFDGLEASGLTIVPKALADSATGPLDVDALAEAISIELQGAIAPIPIIDRASSIARRYARLASQSSGAGDE